MNTQKIDFVIAAANKMAFWRGGGGAVAFGGRSSIGKSSVMNGVHNRKN